MTDVLRERTDREEHRYEEDMAPDRPGLRDAFRGASSSSSCVQTGNVGQLAQYRFSSLLASSDCQILEYLPLPADQPVHGLVSAFRCSPLYHSLSEPGARCPSRMAPAQIRICQPFRPGRVSFLLLCGNLRRRPFPSDRHIYVRTDHTGRCAYDAHQFCVPEPLYWTEPAGALCQSKRWKRPGILCGNWRKVSCGRRYS